VAGLLERFGLTERAHGLPHQLSGGQMQRASIARALCGGQPLLLCDEPTGNLSQAHGIEILETLRRVCDGDGKSVLLVTHNPRDAAYADRVVFLLDGALDPAHTLSGPNLTAVDDPPGPGRVGDLMGPAEIVAWASLRRRPARTLFAVLGVALGIAVVVAVRVVDYTSIQHARPDRAGGWRADLEVRPSRGVADPAAELAAQEGVLRYTAVLQGEAEVRGLGARAQEPGPTQAVALLGLEEAAFEMGVVRAEGDGPREPLVGNSQRVLIGRTLAERAGIGAGDFLLVEPPRRAPIIDCVEGRLVERSRGPDPRPVRFLVDGVLAYENAGRSADGSVVVLHVDDARRLLAGLFHSPAYWVARDEGSRSSACRRVCARGFRSTCAAAPWSASRRTRSPSATVCNWRGCWPWRWGST
jgi:energy-coupling factor transporter ATP-binding protein EcfA2